MVMTPSVTDWLGMVVGSYLVGSIPTAYLVGRLLRGRDVRQYGSGTVSGSMVYEHIARWAVIPVGIFDVFKAALPAWLALRMHMGIEVAVAAGLAAAVGHNWPIYLKFTGGRGISTFAGLLLIIFPWGIPWLGILLLTGYLLKDSAPFALFGFVTMPFLALATGEGSAVIWATILMLAITITKRLEANRRPLKGTQKEIVRVLLRRLLLDRDISDHMEWINRKPNDKQKGRGSDIEDDNTEDRYDR